jgi:hypothetical protein
MMWSEKGGERLCESNYHQKLSEQAASHKQLDELIQARIQEDLRQLPPYLYIHFVGTEPDVAQVSVTVPTNVR